MKIKSILLMAALAALPVGATTILDATGLTGATLGSGDTLTFDVSSGSFGFNARSFGTSRYPTDVTFSLVSAPVEGTGSFWVSLDSADGAYSATFGSLLFSSGTFSGSGYQGAVSTLQGYLHLSPTLSQEIFGAGYAVLSLRNDGPAVTLGLEPYTLRQDLYVSLSGGALSVGGFSSAVSVQALAIPVAPTPEPESGVLFLGGGMLLCVVSFTLRRAARCRKQGETPRKINRLQSSNPV